MPKVERPRMSETPEGLTVETSRRVSYRLVRAPELLDADTPPWCAGPDAEHVSRRLVVIDAGVNVHHAHRIGALCSRDPATVLTHVMEVSEARKTMDTVQDIVRVLTAHGFGRRDEIVAFGGGVLLDLVGVAAALARKGTSYVAVPTTLVGYIDAAIGAKRAVNLDGHKNLLGMYAPARLVVLHLGFLATLDKGDLRAGLAEALKVAHMVDATLFDLIEDAGPVLVQTGFGSASGEDVAWRAIRGMMGQLSGDLFEADRRRWPDHGHTLSPLLEAATGWKMTHGVAVGIDCAMTAYLARRRGLVKDDEYERMIAVYHRLHLPVHHPALTQEGLFERVLAAARHHRDGQLNWPMPKGIGSHTFADDVTAVELEQAATALRMSRPKIGGGE